MDLIYKADWYCGDKIYIFVTMKSKPFEDGFIRFII